MHRRKPIPTREARFGRRLVLVRWPLGATELKIRPATVFGAATLVFAVAAFIWWLSPLSRDLTPTTRRALFFGALLLPYPILFLFITRFVDTALVTLNRSRTQRVRRALSLHVRGRLHHADREALAREIHELRELATTRLGQPLGVQGSIYVANSNYWFRLAFMLACTLPLVASQFTKSHPLIAIPATQSTLVAIVVLFMYGSRLPRRISHAIRAGQCPDCRYDLSTLPSPFASSEPRPINSGPERCPECGAPWPLIPPAFDELPTQQSRARNA